jgi:hypothetical protein
VTVGHHERVQFAPLVPDWSPADDVDVAALWSASGAQALCDPRCGVPDRLVRTVAGLCRYLDTRRAGLAELVGAEGLGALAERAAMLDLPPAGTVSAGGATRLLRCADGWIAVSLPRGDDRQLVPAWLELDMPYSPHRAWRTVTHHVAHRSGTDLIERGAVLGLACAVVGETPDTEPLLAVGLGAAPPATLSGLTVANLGSLWAGPLAADMLARMGARVITVESTARPDGARATPEFFAALHGRSESVELDFRTPGGRHALAELLASVDVVIEGSRPRALEQLGVDAVSLVGHGPRVWMSITGHGRAARPERIGFGDDAAAAGGLVGWVDGEPRLLADAVADPLSGLLAAAAVAQLVESGGCWLVDVALSRTAAAMAGPTSPVRFRADRPRPRRDAGCPLPLGRDTDRVVEELGVRRGRG